MLGPVSISIPTMIIELIIFLLTLYLMEQLVFTPVRRAWAERNRQIEEGLQASTGGREEAERARREVQRILSEARGQSQHILDEAAAAGGQIRDQMVAQATEEFRRLLDAARAEITAERDRSAAALQQRIVDIALLAARQVTGQSYNEPKVRELAATVVQREGLR